MKVSSSIRLKIAGVEMLSANIHVLADTNSFACRRIQRGSGGSSHLFLTYLNNLFLTYLNNLFLTHKKLNCPSWSYNDPAEFLISHAYISIARVNFDQCFFLEHFISGPSSRM